MVDRPADLCMGSWRKVRRSDFEALLDMKRARLAVGA